ncbi:MAG: hypothetical protein BA865_01655 [Desulfobacterales bacterium S5133MH4]|nr:MAG: hypothetical protein BA865_01655 [Desulfobacterales bacterium S5133MH4]
MTNSGNALKTKDLDFTAAYLAVCDIHEHIRTHPDSISSETILALNGVLKNSGFSCQTQSFFLYRETADALASIIVRTTSEPIAAEAVCALKDVLGTATGNPKKATASALGSLPVLVHSPDLCEETVEDIPRAKWQDIQDILVEKGITNCNAPALIGRSLVLSIDKNRLLVVKLASAEDSVQGIYREVVWMKHLCSGGYSFPVRFDIPAAIEIERSYVFRLENIPVRMPDGTNRHPKGYAIGFVANRDYFAYPNEHRAERPLSKEQFKEIMFRNAWLFGKLTSIGIAHSAPIPLFHNRVQTNRRRDHGLYEWQRGGRLDRWLDCCCYPNFGPTGIRDFEHLIALKGTGQRPYSYIGTQILSMLLVAGSYFRNKNRAIGGLDGQGKPVDAQALFDKPFLKELIQGIFVGYYHGFVGTELIEEVPLDLDELTSRMIEEMGVDRYMEEILRVVDQRQMSDEEFSTFLKDRGYSESEIRGLKRGAGDITIYTGPHLGGFNERISLPEIIESVATISALCIADRYWKERFPEPASLPLQELSCTN